MTLNNLCSFSPHLPMIYSSAACSMCWLRESTSGRASTPLAHAGRGRTPGEHALAAKGQHIWAKGECVSQRLHKRRHLSRLAQRSVESG